jgi:hypothetical protein
MLQSLKLGGPETKIWVENKYREMALVQILTIFWVLL